MSEHRPLRVAHPAEAPLTTNTFERRAAFIVAAVGELA
jgi:hypothetical protein